ncbi:hypothetical protein [Streptomyces sp. NPDC007883]|uniref:hypothetical protein n=1 Tax=Streptomyces sp. NPDC007883 TaxID=3155116 RepID=UPI00340EFBB5
MLEHPPTTNVGTSFTPWPSTSSIRRARLFRSRSARAHGSGIGLAVAAELTAADGGPLTADSEVGRCTTFTTRLPVRAR